jgi:hypothetical protein
MVTAAVLRENERNIKSFAPDADGHVRLEGSLRYIMKLHAADGGVREVCCECVCLSDGSCVARVESSSIPAKHSNGLGAVATGLNVPDSATAL